MLPNHPVVGITWYEALAYTRWLTERWRVLGYIGADQGVALPSEPEWEKAARGGLDIIRPDSEHAWPRPAKSGLPALDVSREQLIRNEQPEQRYLWGPDPDPNKANYADTGIDTTSAVGIFPGGASPYGCEEMSGNCWECMRSLWAPYPYPEPAGERVKREALDAPRDRHRVLRGGGFDLDAGDVRCAARNGGGPAYHDGDFGFRVVVRPLL
jgi:formylglycine-generating enzyme required for sulfatase activity